MVLWGRWSKVRGYGLGTSRARKPQRRRLYCAGQPPERQQFVAETAFSSPSPEVPKLRSPALCEAGNPARYGTRIHMRTVPTVREVGKTASSVSATWQALEIEGVVLQYATVVPSASTQALTNVTLPYAVAPSPTRAGTRHASTTLALPSASTPTTATSSTLPSAKPLEPAQSPS